MTESEIRKLLERQRTFFSTGKTLPVSFRLRQLEKLKRSIQKNEPLLRHALKKDLGKSNMESYMCEIGLTLSELSWMQRHVSPWQKTGLYQRLSPSLPPTATVLLSHMGRF